MGTEEVRHSDQFNNSLDSVTKTPTVIRGDHKYIHQGRGYDFTITDIGLANDEVKYMHMRTASDGYTHFKDVRCSDCRVRMYKGSTDYTVSSDTSTIIPTNLNQLSTRPANSDLKFDVGVSSSATGELLTGYQSEVPAVDTREIVLERDEDYFFEVTNIAGAQNNAFLNAFWYEEPEGLST